MCQAARAQASARLQGGISPSWLRASCAAACSRAVRWASLGLACVAGLIWKPRSASTMLSGGPSSDTSPAGRAGSWGLRAPTPDRQPGCTGAGRRAGMSGCLDAREGCRVPLSSHALGGERTAHTRQVDGLVRLHQVLAQLGQQRAQQPALQQARHQQAEHQLEQRARHGDVVPRDRTPQVDDVPQRLGAHLPARHAARTARSC